MNGLNVTVAYFSCIVLGFDRSGNTHQFIGADTGDTLDFNVVTATSTQLTSSTYHYVQPFEVSREILVTGLVKEILEAATKFTQLPDFEDFEDIVIGAYPEMVLKLKGVTVLEGDTRNEEAFKTLAEYYPLVCE